MTRKEKIKLIKDKGLIYEGITAFKDCTALWFTHKTTGSTMLMKEEDITPDSLSVKISDHLKQFGIGE